MRVPLSRGKREGQDGSQPRSVARRPSVSTLVKDDASISLYPNSTLAQPPEFVAFAASDVQYVRFLITQHSLVAPADTILAALGLLGLMGFRRRRNR